MPLILSNDLRERVVKAVLEEAILEEAVLEEAVLEEAVLEEAMSRRAASETFWRWRGNSDPLAVALAKGRQPCAFQTWSRVCYPFA